MISDLRQSIHHYGPKAYLGTRRAVEIKTKTTRQAKCIIELVGAVTKKHQEMILKMTLRAKPKSKRRRRRRKAIKMLKRRKKSQKTLSSRRSVFNL